MSDGSTAQLLAFPCRQDETPQIEVKSLVSSDAASRGILEQIERLAPSDASIMIIGETGTGKEMIARHIHARSGRTGPFVAVNCGALSDSLVDAELFGHERGAFTGAQQAREGWFEAANGGTLFLDEIGDLPLHMQVKLLRVLQERQVVRIGSRKPIAVDVRLVAATNVDLERAIEEKQFRRDLYYRLNVAAVKLSPLRERVGDILPIAQHFIDRYSGKLRLGSVTISPSAALALQAYDWPGNVRELENVIHFGLLMCQNGVLDAKDLRLSASTKTAARTDVLASLGAYLKQVLETGGDSIYESVERLLLTTAYDLSSGNQVHTAKRLGVSRNVVRTQLKRFGMIDGGDAVAG